MSDCPPIKLAMVVNDSTHVPKCIHGTRRVAILDSIPKQRVKPIVLKLLEVRQHPQHVDMSDSVEVEEDSSHRDSAIAPGHPPATGKALEVSDKAPPRSRMPRVGVCQNQ